MAATSTYEPLSAPKHTVRCGNCGYGAIVRVLPEACPMCRDSSWEPDLRQPFRHRHDVREREGRGPEAAA
jgi:hypothetical protein